MNNLGENYSIRNKETNRQFVVWNSIVSSNQTASIVNCDGVVWFRETTNDQFIVATQISCFIFHDMRHRRVPLITMQKISYMYRDKRWLMG